MSWVSLEEIQFNHCSQSSIIGRGFSNTVQIATLRGKEVAVKISNFKNPRIRNEYFREKMIYKQIGAADNVCYLEGSYNDEERGLLILEKARYDAWNYLKSQKTIDLHIWVPILQQIAKGIKEAHEKKVLVRDLHLANVLLFSEDGKFISKLSDFGGSVIEGDKADTFAGSIRHSPKEICIQRQSNQPLTNYTRKTDIYMFGMLIFEILNFLGYKIAVNNGDIDKKRIFPQFKSQKEVINFILTTENMKEYLLAQLSNQEGQVREMRSLIELMKKCVEEDPEERLDIYQVMRQLKYIQKKQRARIHAAEQEWKRIIFKNRQFAKKSNNSVSLYSNDELMSCLQKSIRRCLNSDSAFWLSEITLSGNYSAAMARLTVIASEDLSLSHLKLPQFLLDNWNRFNSEPRLFEKLFILFQTGDILASLKGCKTTNNACGASLQFIEDKIEEVKSILSKKPNKELNDDEISFLEAPNEQYFIKLKELAHRCRDTEDFNAEKEGLCILQRFITEIDKQWHRKVWTEMLSWDTIHQHTKDNMNALFTLGSAMGESGTRLRIFHTFLLFTREKYFPPEPEEFPVCTLSRDDVFYNLKMKLDNIKSGNIIANRMLAIYPFAIDRHTARGKGGPRDEKYQYGKDTTAKLKEAASIYGYNVLGWSEDEIAKSHGPGKKWPRNMSIGSPTLLEQFFDEGSLVFNTIFRQPSVISDVNNGDCMYSATARNFYLFWEGRYDSVEAKSRTVMTRHRKTFVDLQKHHQHSPSNFDASLAQ